MKSEHSEIPYLAVVDNPRRMSGKGAPEPTIFGVLGRTMYESSNKTLGGLVKESTSVKAPKVAEPASKQPKNTERHIIGKAAKTDIPGVHMGQVPYAGMYMSAVGSRL
jgi:hypothetical protein